jgi:hypothetical protein
MGGGVILVISRHLIWSIILGSELTEVSLEVTSVSGSWIGGGGGVGNISRSQALNLVYD